MKTFFLIAQAFLFTLNVSYAQAVKTKIIDNGSSGNYKAIAITEKSLPDFVVYRPQNINEAVKKEGKLPILVWANGGCMNSSIYHERLLSEVASHGYIIIAIGKLQMTVEERIHEHTPDDELLKAIDWISEQAKFESSDYYKNVNLDKIAAGGQSCGGAQTLRVAHDSRIKTYMIFNAGMGDMNMAGASAKSLDNLHGKIVYIIGGESDVAYANAILDYDRIDNVPVAFANHETAGHGGTFAEEFGGSFARIALDWLDWQFKNKNERSKVFLESQLDSYPGWTMKTKNFPAINFNKEVNLNKLGVNPNRITVLDSLLQAFVGEKKVNCVTAFVAKGGNVIYEKAFGLKDIENNIPAKVDDYYVLFSQTKAITTVAFMTLVDKGLVNVDDPVSNFFPEIPDQVVTKVNDDGTYETRPVKSPMTFAHLMSHSSGLNAGLVGEIRRKENGKKDTAPAGFNGVAPESDFNGQRSFGGNSKSNYLSEEMMDLVKYPLGFDPGTEWNYHVSTNMLAFMVEKISGESLQDYVKANILEPLGMKHTDWYYTPDKLSNFVRPYSAIDGKLEAGSMMYAQGAVSENKTYAEGAIGLNGPIEDYAKFCQMLLNKGEFNGHRILKSETVDLMTTINRLPQVNSGGKGFQFGLGFQLANENNKHIPSVSNTAFSWGGMLGTEYIIDPENDLIALFYINMYKRDPLYQEFLKKVYDIFE